MKRVAKLAGLAVGLSAWMGLGFGPSAMGQGYVLAWGWNTTNGQAGLAPSNVMVGATDISAGYAHNLAVKSGRVWAWGNNSHGQTNAPMSARSNIFTVAAGRAFSLALKMSGELVAWGAGALATNIPASLSSGGVSAIAAGEWHALALKNGGVVAWGSNTYGQCDVPAALTNGVTAIDAGARFSMALKNGGVHVFGISADDPYAYGIRDVPSAAASGVSAIAAGYWHALALKNGGVIAWGAPQFDATVVPSEATSGIKAIAAGDSFSMALKTNGQVIVWGDHTKGQMPVPSFATNGAYQVAAGSGHCLVRAAVLPPRFTSTLLPVGYVDEPYLGSVTATGNPAVVYYLQSGPRWLELDPNTGAVSGTPPTNAYYGVTFVASNAFGQATNTTQITVNIPAAGPPVFVTTNPLPSGLVGEYYELQIVASNEPIFSVVAGEGSGLPDGLTLDEDGLLSGIPAVEYDSFFMLMASNSAGCASNYYNITITVPPPPVFVTESPLPDAVVGEPYQCQIEVENNPKLSLWNGYLPAGLVFGTNGWITGTPELVGESLFTIRAVNAGGNSNRLYSLTVLGPPVFVTESPLPHGVLGALYSQQIEILGTANFSLAAGALPGGLTLGTNGWITGMPETAGLFNFTVKATNDYGWSNRVYELAIGIVPVFTTTSPLPGATPGTSYGVQLVATGNPTYSLLSGSLPGGIELASDGLLAGTPSVVGTYQFTVRATNDYGWSDREFALPVGDMHPPLLTEIKALTNGGLRLSWITSNDWGNVHVYSSTNLQLDLSVWSNRGIQVSPWVDPAPAPKTYYHLRLTPP